METAAQSGDPEIAEELLRFYVEQKERECFAAALFTCYDLIRPDVALEVRPAYTHPAPHAPNESGMNPTASLAIVICQQGARIAALATGSRYSTRIQDVKLRTWTKQA